MTSESPIDSPMPTSEQMAASSAYEAYLLRVAPRLTAAAHALTDDDVRRLVDEAIGAGPSFDQGCGGADREGQAPGLPGAT
jgi:hypothetical protein